MIAYPLTIPLTATTRESSVMLIAASVVGINQSPYSYNTQVYDYNSETWGLKVSINPLTREEAQPWVAFITALRGRRGTFLFGPAIMKEPLGTGLGSPIVAGAGQVGRVLNTSGWAANSEVLKADDLFQIDQCLYMSLTSAATNGSGVVSIDVFPSLKTHAASSPVLVSSPVGIFRLTSNTTPVIDVSESGFFNINFEAEEARG